MRSLLALFGANPRKAAKGQEQSQAAGSVEAPAGARDVPIQTSVRDVGKPPNAAQQRCASPGNANQGLPALFSTPPGATFTGPARKRHCSLQLACSTTPQLSCAASVTACMPTPRATQTLF